MTSTTSLLLADDSPTIAKILGMALQAEPIEIRAVQTAEAAMTELQLRPPYFFLVDLMLPEINGYEFSRLIRSDPKLKDVRIVLLSSAFDPIDEAEFQACGADAVIAKPFDPSELREQLHKLQGIAPKPVDPDALDDNLEGDAPSLTADDPSLLLNLNDESAPSGGDADSILSSILSPDSPPAAPSGSQFGALDINTLDQEVANFSAAPTPEPQDPTVILDMSGGEVPFQPEEAVLDLSNSWQTPPGGTAILDATGLASTPEAPPSFDPFATAPPSAPPAAPALSPNAEALAAFFAAEIDANGPPSAPPAAAAAEEPPAPPAEAEEDSFDASLSSIDWGGPAEVSLNSWSAPPPKKTLSEAPSADPFGAGEPPAAPPARAPQTAPAPAAPERPPAPPAAAAPSAAPAASRPAAATSPASPPQSPPASRPAAGAAPTHAPPSSPPAAAPKSGYAGASSDRGSFLFDTGGSNFRFADDYVQRITRAFTGAVDEMVLGKDPAPTPSPSGPVFPRESHDSSPAAAESPRLGGGGFSAEEVQRIEQLVREEVQLVVREMVEKVAWEVIPELAENLIRKQLDQVLKQMEE